MEPTSKETLLTSVYRANGGSAGVGFGASSFIMAKVANNPVRRNFYAARGHLSQNAGSRTPRPPPPRARSQVGTVLASGTYMRTMLVMFNAKVLRLWGLRL